MTTSRTEPASPSAGPGSHPDLDSALPPPVQSRGHRRLALVLALAFLFTPTVAFVLGARAHQIENRRLTAFPSLDRGWHWFGDFQTWAVDHLPLRDKAVQADTKLSEGVFNEPPSFGSNAGSAIGTVTGDPSGASTATLPRKAVGPQVVQGKGGWLYFGADFTGPCDPVEPLDQTLAKVNRLAKIVEASGRRFVLTVAPDKSTILPQHLPANYENKDCSQKGKAAFWQRLQQDPPEGYLDLRGPLQAAQAAAGSPAYRPHDTHWSPLGSATYARLLANRLDPRLWQTTTVRTGGTWTHLGDLSVMLGNPLRDTLPAYDVVRPGVTTTKDTSSTIRNTTTDAPVFAPETLILGDSFTRSSHDATVKLFGHAEIRQPFTARADPDGLIRLMQSSQVVIYEVVERTLDGGDTGILDTAFLDRLERSLKRTR